MEPADSIDPEYGRLLRQAYDEGVEILAYGTSITPREIKVSGAIAVRLQAI